MASLTLLEKRQQRLTQQKNRIKDQEYALKHLERKQRTRQLIELGGLVSKAKLEDVAANTILGALLEIKTKLQSDKSLKEKWTKIGGAEFAKDNIDKTAVIVSFQEKPSAETRVNIRELGLKWNNFRKEWHGHVKLDLLRTALQNESVTIDELKK